MLKHRWVNITIVGMLLISLGVMITPRFELGDAVAAQAEAAQVAGDYYGEVQLQFTVAGLYSDPLVLPPPTTGTPEPPDLGIIDLALNLSQNDSAISGYVNLDKTLVFAAAHTIKNGNKTLKIGPNVNGSFDGTTLTLVSERVAATLGGQPIERQFRLSGTIIANDGSRISGEYRETLWGAAHQPVTVIGAFTLQRTVFATVASALGNRAPVTVADRATIAQGAAITINVLANDTDVDGDTLVITAVSKPQFGTAETNGQTVTYRPNASFVGQDNFSYFVSDGQGNPTAGSITVFVGIQPTGNAIYLPLMRR